MGLKHRWLQLTLLVSLANAGWPETINLAGMQRTLSQMMTKEFLLISRGTSVAEYKVKLQESMSSFNSTLYALMTGDPARDIIPAPNSQVANALQKVLVEWLPMEELLRTNAETVRRSDGTIDMPVLEELNSRNVPLLHTSNAVVKALVDAAQVSGETTSGLVQDIAGRQRTLIQRLAKGILLLSQGVAMSFNMEAYRDTKSLFEASHEGIIQGVPFAGLPVLRDLCTLHQMREVSFYYQKLRPLLTGITNADTPSSSQTAADAVAEEVVDLVDPLYFSMVEAVKLFSHENECSPANSTTYDEWLAFFTTLSAQRLLTQRSAQYFTQVGLKVDMKNSQVEITVMLSQASSNLRNLIEGNKIRGIPAPPSQSVVDKLLDVTATWKTFESELEAAIHLESVSTIILNRVELLAKNILKALQEAEHLAMPMLLNSDVPAAAVEVGVEQALAVSEMAQSALHIIYNMDVAANWERLNASRATIEATRWQLLQGVPATETSLGIQKVTDVCIVQQVKVAMDLYSQAEQAALKVAHGDRMEVDTMIRMSHLAVGALENIIPSLTMGNGTCGNSTLAAEEWQQLHLEVAHLAALGAEVATEFLLFKHGSSPNSERLDALVLELESSLRRIMFGSFDPPVAAPPTQSKFDHILQKIDPTFQQLIQAVAGDLDETVLRHGQDLTRHAESLQEQYFTRALAADPVWPGHRVHLASGLEAQAYQVFQAVVLFSYDLVTSETALQEVIDRFQVALHQLRDGGDDFAAIMMPERQDLMNQWGTVQNAWDQVLAYQSSGFQVSDLRKIEITVNNLVLEIQNLLPLLSVEDVKFPDSFPWSAVIYSIIGFVICSCCCFIICVPWCLRQSKRRDAAKTVERSERAAVADSV